VDELTIGTAGGRSLTVYDAGDPDGRPLLFHHGTPASGVPFDGELDENLLESMRRSVSRNVDAWVDDDLAFTRPWGFELESIRVPTLVVQGRQDLMVLWAHGQWLAGNLPSAEAWLREDQGHLTLFVSVVPHIHEWLLERFTWAA
jgi:pimeloyl-ACP methyl ester carboxylesterase